MKLKDLNPRGTYVAVKPTATAIELLTTWAREHGLELVDDPHVTVLYSRKEIPTIPRPEKTYMATPASFEQFDDDCLVLRLTCQGLDDLHNGYRELGGTHDYPKFNPHLTIAKGSKLKPEDLSIPNFNIPLSYEYSEPLDLNK